MGHIIISGHQILFDDDDLDLVQSYQWHLHKSAHTNYARGYRKGEPRGGQKLVYMHRLIMLSAVGATSIWGLGTDHINGNGMDNRRGNLRLCNQSQNNANRHVPQTKTSPYKGVHFDAATGRYRAEITKDGKRYRLGRFPTAEEAVTAYTRKSIELFGRFAVYPTPFENEVRQ